MGTKKTILITGATGKQGGAVARHLDGKGFHLRGMTRKPDSEAARALAGRGVEIVPGDHDDEASLRKAVEGAWGVFAVQNTWEAGVDREEDQGKRLARVARDTVQHFVYTSVGSAHKDTGIPHFDNKGRVEDTVRALEFPSYAIIRPVFFMENLTSPWFLQGDQLTTALDPTTRLQMIASDDIGRIAAVMFERAEEMNRTELDLAGDALTMPEAAAILAEALGRPITYKRIPIEAVRANSAELAIMLEWFDRTGYSADIPALEQRFGPMTKLRDWAKRQG
jgi:uncharacterized protein YbjT (DUF2867 family)